MNAICKETLKISFCSNVHFFVYLSLKFEKNQMTQRFRVVPVAANSGGIVYYNYIIKLSRLVQKCRVRVPKRGGMSVRRRDAREKES